MSSLLNFGAPCNDPMSSTSRVFASVSLTASQENQLELMMKQQVQDAIFAQLAIDPTHLDPHWRFVGSLGQLKTYKLRGIDLCSSTSSWATTLPRNTRATTGRVDESCHAGSNTFATNNRSSTPRLCKRLAPSRRTISTLTGSRDPHLPLQSYRIVGRVQGHYRDIVDVHSTSNTTDFVKHQKLLCPDVVDGAVLHTLRATRDSFLGIKWLVENHFGCKRDVCYVEMVGYTTNLNGQEIGFVATASIEVPECPDFSKSMKLTRVRMKRTLLVGSSATTKGTSDLFVMGATDTNEPSIIEHAHYRTNMARLNDLLLVIDSRNIAKQPLVPYQHWLPDKSCLSCGICSRKFHFMHRRRHHCRLCGDVICKTCNVTRGVLDAYGTKSTAIWRTKFCVRCVMSLRAVETRQSKISLHHSRSLLLAEDPSNVSESSIEHSSWIPNVRGSHTKNFKRGSGASKFYKKRAAYEKRPIGDDNQTNRSSGRVSVGETLSSYSWDSSKYFRPSLAVNPLHSSSYGKLHAPSRLSRHYSMAK